MELDAFNFNKFARPLQSLTKSHKISAEGSANLQRYFTTSCSRKPFRFHTMHVATLTSRKIE